MIIDVDVDRALRIVKTLGSANFQPLFVDIEEVVEKSFILPLKHRTTNVKLDLAIGLSGFEQQTIGAEPIELGGTTIPVATAEDLLILKILAGRPRDEEDVKGLVIAAGDHMDWKYCLRVAADLGEALGVDLKTRVELLKSHS